MAEQQKRGSEKLMAAWKARTLTDKAVGEIAEVLDKSPAKVETVNIVGGANATGIQLRMTYEGDDVPMCGNDILFWLKWHINHGGIVRPPKIIINGIPFPDIVRLELDFGHVGANVPGIENIPGTQGVGGA
ncbi:MAG TPA: hypothetical protein VK901_08135 [Nitrospiraceae bacterium]|nr:hypothetical protein [Nitrospiraceae bacterium]